MKFIAKRPTPAALAVLRQATAHFPRRKKASDGLLPSAAHMKASPNSDHNTGFAVDLTHDPKHHIDCAVIYLKLKKDKRVKYLIFKGKIWSKQKGETKYTGSNQHEKHLHISIKDECGEDTSPWFPWLAKPKTINKVRAKFPKPLPKKKETKCRNSN
jgi:hypothetical protein|tara:strand:- start:3088 stop:3558 length:471 start_codon:yes stop_codon:yes gene_type:complete